jgi:ABC-type uncharacterized transport system substrate-binding protein
MSRGRAGALAVWATGTFVVERRRLVALAAKNRLPVVYTLSEFVDVGGLMAYGHRQADLNRRAASYVDISKHVGRVNRESIVIDAVAA